MAGLDKLMAFDDAVAAVERTAIAYRDGSEPELREVDLWEASGSVVAGDVVSDRDQPPFDKSMMDGFAVRAQDVAAGVQTLRVIGEIAAGSAPGGPLGPGEAVAIMTGAPLPEGADAVQMIERTQPHDNGHVAVEGPVTVGQNVARRGEDVAAGAVVVEAGRVVESLTAGVLGSVGASKVSVFQRPRVTVMTTGSELVALEATPGPHQIRDSNRRTLFALLERERCRVVDGGIVPDDAVATRQAIRTGLASDILVLSGGVSVGTYDLVRAALEDEGVEIVFHRTRVKPGKPVLFGRHRGGLVFGLPGNPVSSYVCAVLFLLPAARILGRRPTHRTWTLRLPLVGDAVPTTGGRTTFHPADLVRGAAGDIAVRYRDWGGSADQVAFARADVMIRRDAGAPAACSGETVTVVLPHSLASW